MEKMEIEKGLESLCSPVLNTQCSKTNCYINGGQCYQTICIKYTQKDLIERLNKIIERIEPLVEWGECTINGKILKEIYDIAKGE